MIPRFHHRRSVRLPGYDYSQPGAYFVTICTFQRVCTLDNDARRRAVQQAWDEIPLHCPNAAVDEFVVMPNHVHGIIWIMRATTVGAHHDAPLRAAAAPRSTLLPGSLGAIVLQFKSAAARRINQIAGTPGAQVWQRNYYEHVIRDSDELNIIRRYIRDNPLNWDQDPDNPANP